MSPSGSDPRLIADAMLGSLARWLRVLGVDTAYEPDLEDGELVARAAAEGRTILTRDRGLVERRAVRRRHVLIRSEGLEEQLRQVLGELAIRPRARRLFGRCLRCNVVLQPLAPAAARGRVPPHVVATVRRFRECPRCRRVYWRASHVRRMLRRLEGMELVSERGRPWRRR